MKAFLTKKPNCEKYYIGINEKDETGKWKRKWVATGTSNKKEAEKKLIEILHQKENGTFVNPDKMTYGEFVDKWMEQHVKTNCQKTTYDGYKSVIDKHTIPFLGKILLQKLCPIDLQRYYNHLLEKGRADGKGGLSANTVKHHHANIHKSLDYALKMQLIARNVAEAVEIPKKKNFESHVYDKEQVGKMLELCKNTRLFIPINLAVGLGLRRSEICGLRWQDIDFKNNKISIKQARVRSSDGDIIKDPKSKAGIRTLKAELPLMNLLKAEKHKQKEQKIALGDSYYISDFVFRNDDGSLVNPSRLSHMFDEFLEKYKLPDIRLHDLRHTNITLLLQNKVSYKVVQQRAGHSDIGILFNTYGHVIEEMEQEAIQNIIYSNSN